MIDAVTGLQQTVAQRSAVHHNMCGANVVYERVYLS